MMRTAAIKPTLLTFCQGHMLLDDAHPPILFCSELLVTAPKVMAIQTLDWFCNAGFSTPPRFDNKTWGIFLSLYCALIINAVAN